MDKTNSNYFVRFVKTIQNAPLLVTIFQYLKRPAELISYGFPILVLGVLIIKLANGVLFGDLPVLQNPPDGYLAAGNVVRLDWRRGNHEGDFLVKVAEECDFNKIVFKKITNMTKVIARRLPRGKKYCWRIIDSDDASTRTFYTTQSMIPL